MDIVEFTRGVQTIHTRHGNVENDEIGVYFGGAFDGIESVGSLAANLETRRFQQLTDSGADGSIIVHNEDTIQHATPPVTTG